MMKRLMLSTMAIALLCGPYAVAGLCGVETILGKWQVKAEGPNGPLDLEFVFKLDGDQLTGVASTDQGSLPFSTVKFEEPNLTMELALGDSTYSLKATLKNDTLDGTWEKVGGDSKGPWTGKRSPAPAQAVPAGGILGAWSTVAVTPNGDMAATLEIKQEAEKLTGVVSSEMGSLPVQGVSFKENKLQFDIELGGNVYRVQAALAGDKLTGAWAPAAGGEGGEWRATRKAAAPPSAPVPTVAPEVLGSWNVVAASPEGNLQFIAEVQQDGQAFKGTLKAPDGSIEMKEVAFSGGKLTFVVDYMGGTYRVEATIAGDKLTGKWSAVGGSDSGSLSGERKKP